MARQNYVSGGNATRIKLSKMSREAGKPIKETLEKVAQQMETTAKERVPDVTGSLRDSIEYHISSDGVTAMIGPSLKKGMVRSSQKNSAPRLLPKNVDFSKIRKSTRDAYWQAVKGYWTEFGTKGGVVKLRKDSGKKTLSDGDAFFGDSVVIPPQPAQPFMNPAFEAHKGEAVQELNIALKRMMQQIANERGV